jgi:hypothetical protein
MHRAASPLIHKKTQWIKQYPEAADEPSKISHIVLSREETRNVAIKANTRQVSVGRWIFWALNETISANCIKADSPYYWLIPIDLRGALTRPDDTANHISRMLVPCRAHMDLHELTATVKQELDAKTYWGNYFTVKLFIDLFGIRGAKLLFRLFESTERFAGAFTLLKEYPISHPENPELDDHQQLIVCGGNSRVMPVNCTCLTWNGRISVTLRIHPTLAPEQAMVDRHLDRLAELLLP